MYMCHIKKTPEIGNFPNLPVKSENDEFCCKLTDQSPVFFLIQYLYGHLSKRHLATD